jgi:hypothetical protein
MFLKIGLGLRINNFTSTMKRVGESHVTIEKKIKVLEDIDSGKSRSEVARCHRISKSAVNKIHKLRGEIKSYEREGMNTKMKHLVHRPSTYYMYDKVITWIDQMRGPGIPVHGSAIKGVAISFAEELGSPFNASNGWLHGLFRRFSLREKRITGESIDVDQSVVSEWMDRLPAMINSYADADIFNCDESSLYYKAIKNTTICRPKDPAKGIKSSLSKQRATMLLTASMTGERLEPLIIWKCAKKPRDFSFEWHHNKKAWMTRDIFEDYLSEFNEILVAQNRNIYLFMDNVSTHHKVSEYSNIKIDYLPKNTTSATQPLDQGIIKVVKNSYRSLLTQHLYNEYLRYTEEGVPFTMTKVLKNITVTQAASWLNQAWFGQLKDCTITHCFEHAGFVQQSIVQTSSVEFDDVIADLMAEFEFVDDQEEEEEEEDIDLDPLTLFDQLEL